MTVIYSTISRAQPGRRREAIALAAQAAKIVQRHGAKDCRLLLADTAGEAAGTHVFSAEFDNAEAYGVFSDKAAVDPEVEALVDQISGADSPVVTEFQGLVTELPLGRTGKPGHGSVVQVYVSRPLPGRFEASLDLARRAFDFVEGHGATNARLFQQSLAGSMSDTLVATWEFDSMRAFGHASDAFASEPAGQALAMTLRAIDCPIAPVSVALYSAIRI